MAASFVSLALLLAFTLGGDLFCISPLKRSTFVCLYSLGHVGLFEFMPCSYEVTASGMRGMGWSVLPTIVVIVGSCLLRIVYVFTLFPLIRSFENLMLIYPVTWIVTGATMIALYLYARKKSYGR